MAKISVIIPVYNVEKYLARCLESVIAQTFKDIEIICVNDGSTDSSLGILRDFEKKDERIVIIEQENKGLAGARNTGLSVAKGEFINFVDSDDWIAPETLETVVNLMTDDVDFVNFGINSCGEISEKQRKKENKLETIKFTGKRKIDEKTILTTQVYVWNKLFKKSLIDKYEIQFPEGLYYEDCVFTYSYLSIAKNGYYIQDRFYNYFKRKDSIMAKTKNCHQRSIDHVYCMEKYLNFLEQYNLTDNFKSLFENLFKHYCKLTLKYSNKDETILREITNITHKYCIGIELDNLKKLKLKEKIQKSISTLIKRRVQSDNT